MFHYSHSDLYCDDLPLSDLASRVGTRTAICAINFLSTSFMKFSFRNHYA